MKMGDRGACYATVLACNLPNLECEQYPRINTLVSLTNTWERGVGENSKDLRIISTNTWTFSKS